jgi:hypothetical protein
VFPLAPALVLILTNEEVLEEVAQELQCHILERERRPVKQLQQMYVLVLVEGHGRSNVFGAECSVAAANDVFEVGGRDLGGRDVEGEDLVCEVLEGQVVPFRGPVAGKHRDLFWDEQAAVGGEALKNDVLEGKLAGQSGRSCTAIYGYGSHRRTLPGCSGSAGTRCV